MKGSASVLPSAIFKNDLFYYFGLEKDKLSTFGGKLEENESVEEGAVREFREESLDVFCSEQRIKKIFSEKRYIEIKNEECNNSTYIVYLKTDNFVKKFDEKRENQKLSKCEREIKKIIPISAKVLCKALRESKPNSACVVEGYAVRKCVADTLMQALKDGDL